MIITPFRLSIAIIVFLVAISASRLALPPANGDEDFFDIDLSELSNLIVTVASTGIKRIAGLQK